MRIQLDAKHQALAKGITAGGRALEQVKAAGGGDYESRLAFFWLAVGMGAPAEEGIDLNDPELQEVYIRGAASNAPAKRELLPEARIAGRDLLCGHKGCDAVIDTLREKGYIRDWGFDYDGEKAYAHDRGLSSYSENGDGDYVAVCARYHDNEVPFEDWEWN